MKPHPEHLVPADPADPAVPVVPAGEAAATAGRRAVVAVGALFLANGLAVGAFGGSLPGQRARFDLSEAQIVAVLVSVGLPAIASMNLGGRIADRSGARLPALAGGVLMALSAVAVGLAPSYALLLVAAVGFGLGNGAMDVAMNVLGVRAELDGGRPVMSRLHAFFSIGNLLGALLVVTAGLFVADLLTPRWALGMAGALVAALLLAARGALANGPAPQATDSGDAPSATPAPADGPRAVRRATWLLGVMALCIGLTEGTAVDWSSLHVTEVGGVGPSTGAWGLAAVAGLMVVVRLLGDAIVERLGRAMVIRAGGGIALAGYVLTVVADGLVTVLLGWALVGLGVGLVAPQIYGLAGHLGGGRGMALVVSFGYAAFLTGPALIGLAAGQVGLQHAMLVPVVSALGLIALAAGLPPAGPDDRRTARG